MWDSWRLTTLQASTPYCSGAFTFLVVFKCKFHFITAYNLNRSVFTSIVSCSVYRSWDISRYSDGIPAGRPSPRSSSCQCNILLLLCLSVEWKPSARPTLSPNRWLPRDIVLRVKQQIHEVNPSPASSVEVKNGRSILPRPHTSTWCSA
jgi:hypothetical protein